MTDNSLPKASSKLSNSVNNIITNELVSRIKYENSKNMVNSILDDFIEMIISGRIQPGYAFPNENEMCEQLQISRSTLREVYSALAAMGFITRTKHGTVVNDKQYISSAVPLRYLLKGASMENLRDFRYTLESQTACLAAQRADNAAIETLKEILENMKRNARPSKATTLSKLDYEFHITIARASGNELLLNTLCATVNELERSAFSGYYLCPEESMPKSIQFHEKIIEAIEQRDAVHAKHAMEAHVRDIYAELRNYHVS